ncbi:MAG: magnesium chelatase domain-containing protein, partial [Flavobacteriaceae bacterium]
MLTQIFASAVFGIDAVPITIEVHIDAGIGYHLVGLPDNAVKESNYRIAAALTNTNYKLPGKRITINLAPADLQKEGSAYDLPIAIGILAADGQIQPTQLESCCMMGELTLDGHLRPIKGVLPIAVQAKASGFQSLIVPAENAKEAAVVDGLDVYGFSHIKEIISFLEGTPFGKSKIYSTAKATVLKKTRGHYPALIEAIDLIKKNGLGYGNKVRGKKRDQAIQREAEVFGKLS